MTEQSRSIEDPQPGEIYDDLLRWTIPSDSDPHVNYIVELDSFESNGECQCKWFETQYRPLLSRMVTPAEALQQGLVKLMKYQQRDEDCLRCKHILEGFRRYACSSVKAISNLRKTHAPKNSTPPRQQPVEAQQAPPRFPPPRY